MQFFVCECVCVLDNYTLHRYPVYYPSSYIHCLDRGLLLCPFCDVVVLLVPFVYL